MESRAGAGWSVRAYKRERPDPRWTGQGTIEVFGKKGFGPRDYNHHNPLRLQFRRRQIPRPLATERRDRRKVT